MPLSILKNPPRYLFFTGKGGVGKTSLATAAAITLADSGRKVLLVSTDAASNLDQMLGVALSNKPVSVPGVPTLQLINIDPEAAAEAYRQRVLERVRQESSAEEVAHVREQLSGACTTEIAAFDEFTALLSGNAGAFDCVVFDTAPTGHTLRLLSLPKAWTGFLAGNDRGASCLGPHSGLKMQEERFKTAMQVLGNPELTAVILVTRPEHVAIAEAARTSQELSALGLGNQRLIINGVFHATDAHDAVARAIETVGRDALANLPAVLKSLPSDEVALRPFDTIGLQALRSLLDDKAPPPAMSAHIDDHTLLNNQSLADLADELAAGDKGLIMVMGKGGVGKTTVAAALAIGLVQRGKTVHLSTTDPAAHLSMTLDGIVDGLQVSRIDPKEETRRYIDKIMAARAPNLDAGELALLREDLESPCTEEVAVFHAFSKIVSEARSAFVVLDTAPTGHSLLLIDATGAYHRQSVSTMSSSLARVVTPLMRLQDPAYTKVILVTLPETTPVTQAQELQDDLRRASIHPFGWVINKSMLAANPSDPVLVARLAGEEKQLTRVDQLASRIYMVPWLPTPPVGVEQLSRLVNVVAVSGAV